eukprot:gene17479-9088_t
MEYVHPICCTQKIAVYETKTRFYLVASNNAQTRFRVLKIDRTEPTELVLIDDKVEYNQKQIRTLLQMIDVGNRPKASRSYDKGISGLHHRGSAFGIVGFVKFLEGYYMILISKRRRVALIGGHTIYKIDDTVMIPIANEQARIKFSNPDETSYSYDPTHTLQYNLAPNFGLPEKFVEKEPEDGISTDVEAKVFMDGLDKDLIRKYSKSDDPRKEASPTSKRELNTTGQQERMTPTQPEASPVYVSGDECETSFTKKKVKYNKKQYVPYRGRPYEKFVWNIHLLENFKEQVHPDWILYIIHGFVGQSRTRFLKRGVNDEGFVANDVETEQIAHDASFISLKSGRYTSYTQLRGSAPFYWSQDTSQGRIVPKPQILVDRTDPYYASAALHLNKLMARFGAPIIILNLVKKRERRPHEQILSENLKQIVVYVNQFIPPEFAVQYIAWDMARVTKRRQLLSESLSFDIFGVNNKEISVIERLAEIAEKIVKETGFFHSGPQLYCNKIRSHPKFNGMKGYGYNKKHPGLCQTGILRVNCVDCLDRTNTAQFMVGKCALGFQLYALGVTDSPHIEFDSDVVSPYSTSSNSTASYSTSSNSTASYNASSYSTSPCNTSSYNSPSYNSPSYKSFSSIHLGIGSHKLFQCLMVKLS